MFWVALRNNMIIVVGSVVLQVGFGTILAAILDRGLPRGATIFRTIIFAPMVVSSVAVALIWLIILDPNIGSLNALVFQLASLTDVHWAMSGDVVLMTLLGGLGTVFGPVVGAFVVIAMENYLAPFGQWVLVIQGAIFVVCVLLFRRGIVGELAHALRVRL